MPPRVDIHSSTVVTPTGCNRERERERAFIAESGAQKQRTMCVPNSAMLNEGGLIAFKSACKVGLGVSLAVCSVRVGRLDGWFVPWRRW